MAESKTASESNKSGVEALKNKRPQADPPRVNIIAFFSAFICFGLGLGAGALWNTAWPIVAGALIGMLVSASPKVASQWERAIVLRLGRYVGLRRPGSSGSFQASIRSRAGSTSEPSRRVSPPSKP